MKQLSIQKFKLVLEFEEGYTATQRVHNKSSALAAFEDLFKLSKQSEEVLCMLCLNAKIEIIGAFEVARGGISSAIFSPKEILKRALSCNASAIIMAHNHPSGHNDPSGSDIKATRDLNIVCKALELDFCDHFIIPCKPNLREEDVVSLRSIGALR